MDFSKLAALAAKIPINLIANSSSKVNCEVPWAEEREEILARARWLCGQVLVSPKELLAKMPKELGRFYGGQWAIYSAVMTVAALANIIRIYPEQREECLPKMKQLIDLINTKEIRRYDTMQWKEDALETLDGPNDHMTYLSLLSWAIINYKQSGGTAPCFDALLHDCCEALHRHMVEGPDLNLQSFPGKPIFLPDMLFTIIALHHYGVMNGGAYAETLSLWRQKAQTEWINQQTGLLSSTLTRVRRKPGRIMRGSHVALNCSCLTLCGDEAFARSQYELMKKHFVKTSPLFGIREYLDKSPMFSFDVDAGPIMFGLSPSGTAFALGAATWWEDWEIRARLLQTASIAGDTVTDADVGTSHYRLAEMALVGEAVTLAMRTLVRRKE